MTPFPAKSRRSDGATVGCVEAAKHVAERVALRKETAVLEPGTTAPAFSLPDQDGHLVSLADQAGHWVLLWWYPKAATPG